MCDVKGVTQVDEKGHEGSTAVVAAYNIYVGENMFKERARQEFLLTNIIHFEYYYRTTKSDTPNYSSAGAV